MATWYVDSTATGGTGAGTSWTNACLTLAAAITLSAAGDDFNLYSGHSESNAANLALAFKGTAASPNRIFSCDRTNTPAQASDLVAGATVATTTTHTITLTGCFYCYGVKFNAGSSTSAAKITVGGANGKQVYEAVTLALTGSGTSAQIVVAGTAGADDGTRVEWLNTVLSFSAAQSIMLAVGAQLLWRDTPSALIGTVPTTLFQDPTTASSGGTALFDGVDLSAMGAGKTIVGGVATNWDIVLANCRLGASVTVAATSAGPYGPRVDLLNCDSGATGYRSERYWYEGTLTTETVVVRSGGASDGDETISWKVVTTANAKAYFQAFETFETAIWFAAGAHTATFEVITDNVVLTNADLWCEAQYLGNASYPLASLATTGVATPLTSGSNLSVSSATWTTTGLTTPKPQFLTVSFTTDLDGYVRFKFKVGKASTTVRIDPKPSATT